MMDVVAAREALGAAARGELSLAAWPLRGHIGEGGLEAEAVGQVGTRDLSAVPRAVVIPPGVSHYYVPLASSVKLRRLTPAAAAKPTPAR